MPVDPFLKPLLGELPTLPKVIDYPSYRVRDDRNSDELFTRYGQPGPDVREHREVTIPVPGGTIELFVYFPFKLGPHPVHLFLHGGGWTLGSIRQVVVDATCRERCIGAQCVVVAANYRKAPEQKFPTALEDSHAALLWIAEHEEELGVRLDKLSVGGLSAGGNLAAALCLKVRDEGGPRIALQLLEIPTLDLTFSQPSTKELATGYGLTLHALEIHRRDYLVSLEDRVKPYASPLLAPDLSRLPPAHIMTAEYGPLRADGAAYATRLREAGVAASYSIYSGHIHGSSGFTKVMPSARAWRDELLSVLRRVSEQDEIMTEAL